MTRRLIVGSMILLLLVNIVGPLQRVTAVGEKVRNPLEWLANLETAVLGASVAGNLLDRLASFEKVMVGRVREDSLVQRLIYLDTLIYHNQPYDIAVNYKIQALEWVIFGRIFPGPLRDRAAKLEQTLFGIIYDGPLAGRMEKMVTHVFPHGAVQAHWTSIPEGLVVRVRLLDEISSIHSQVGDTFRFSVVETVTHNEMVVIPQGALGSGNISAVTRPKKLGIDARLMLNLKEIRALDSTLVPLRYGAKINRPQQLAVGASAAGMLALGPGGIIIGMAVKGKEKVLPVGTEFYAQVDRPVRIYTLAK
jgi:hypothetical protein